MIKQTIIIFNIIIIKHNREITYMSLCIISLVETIYIYIYIGIEKLKIDSRIN